MDLIISFIEFILHFDTHVTGLLADYQVWVYAILFGIIFCETGLVVTPFLPGDSLLFAVGALAAVDRSGTLDPLLIWLLLIAAAVLGNEVNFRIGRAIGAYAFGGGIPWLRQEYLLRTQAFYERHGGKTIILSRFIPIIRTFAPFVAGVGCMQSRRFAAYNFTGGFLWVTAFVWSGYLFGNMPVVENNFGVVTIAIIVISVVPVVWGLPKPGNLHADESAPAAPLRHELAGRRIDSSSTPSAVSTSNSQGPPHAGHPNRLPAHIRPPVRK